MSNVHKKQRIKAFQVLNSIACKVIELDSETVNILVESLNSTDSWLKMFERKNGEL